MEVNGATGRAAVQTGAAPDDGALVVLVRYWASARAAAGRESEELQVTGPVSLAEVLGRLEARHDDAAYSRVLGVCSVLVDDRPAGGADPGDVEVLPGQTVQLLPPFAGG